MRRRLVRGHMDPVEPEINVTPLVDVVLVLLIIFMVVVPQMRQERPVELPRAANVDPDVKVPREPWTLTLVRSGEVFVGTEQVPAESLRDKLLALRSEDVERRLVLRADKDVSWAQVRSVLGEVREAGYPGASLLVAHRRAEGSSTEQGG